MVIYKYNPVKDFKIFFHNRKNKEFLETEKIYVVKWSLGKYIKFIFGYYFKKIERPRIDTDKEVVCYFVSSGTWGSYNCPNEIFICPIELEKLSMNLSDLIKHEIKHLKFENDVKGMTHKEKEKFINTK